MRFFNDEFKTTNGRTLRPSPGAKLSDMIS